MATRRQKLVAFFLRAETAVGNRKQPVKEGTRKPEASYDEFHFNGHFHNLHPSIQFGKPFSIVQTLMVIKRPPWFNTCRLIEVQIYLKFTLLSLPGALRTDGNDCAASGRPADRAVGKRSRVHSSSSPRCCYRDCRRASGPLSDPGTRVDAK